MMNCLQTMRLHGTKEKVPHFIPTKIFMRHMKAAYEGLHLVFPKLPIVEKDDNVWNYVNDYQFSSIPEHYESSSENGDSLPSEIQESEFVGSLGISKLQLGWIEARDPATGLIYYYNESTGISLWEVPIKNALNTQSPYLEPLPHGWVEIYDNCTCQYYYYNEYMKVSQWEYPCTWKQMPSKDEGKSGQGKIIEQNNKVESHIPRIKYMRKFSRDPVRERKIFESGLKKDVNQFISVAQMAKKFEQSLRIYECSNSMIQRRTKLLTKPKEPNMVSPQRVYGMGEQPVSKLPTIKQWPQLKKPSPLNSTKPQPFHLRTMERGLVKKRRFAEEILKKHLDEEQAHIFKARPVPKYKKSLHARHD